MHLDDCIPRLDQIPLFQDQLYDMDKSLEKILDNDKSTPFDHSYFLYQYALELNWPFQFILRVIFNQEGVSVSGCIKSNLARIAQKINEKKEELKINEEEKEQEEKKDQ